MGWLGLGTCRERVCRACAGWREVENPPNPLFAPVQIGLAVKTLACAPRWTEATVSLIIDTEQKRHGDVEL